MIQDIKAYQLAWFEEEKRKLASKYVDFQPFKYQIKKIINQKKKKKHGSK